METTPANQSDLDKQIALLHQQFADLQSEEQKLQLKAQLERQVANARANIENLEKQNP